MAAETYLSPNAASNLKELCSEFINSIGQYSSERFQGANLQDSGTFRSAVEISNEFDRCVRESLPLLLEGFTSQADALGVMFGIAGGVISAQDEAAAEALQGAASMPLNSVGFSAPLGLGAITITADPARQFAAVAEEDPYALSLEQMVQSGTSLDSTSVDAFATQLSQVATDLADASATLHAGVSNILGNDWRGEFAETAATNVAAFCDSADQLANVLTVVSNKASGLSEGFVSTKSQLSALQVPPTTGEESDTSALNAAEEDARRVVSTDYNPRVVEADLSSIILPAAHRVVAGGLTEGPIAGINPVSLWNDDVPDPSATSGGFATSNTGGVAASSSANGAGATHLATSGRTLADDVSANPQTRAAVAAPVTQAESTQLASTAAATPPAATSPSTSSGGGAGGGPVAATSGIPGSNGGRSPAVSPLAATSPRTTSATSTSRALPSTSSALGTGNAGSRSAGLPRGNSSYGFGGSAGAGSSPRAPLTAGLGGVGGLGSPGGLSGLSTSGSSGFGIGGAGMGGATGRGSAAGVGPGMAAMPMGAGSGQRGDKNHTPASYLVHPLYTKDLLGTMPHSVDGVLKGHRTQQEKR